MLGQEIAQRLCLLAVESAAPRRTLAALRQRRDDAVQRADILFGRRDALKDVAQVDLHDAALFRRAKEFDPLQFAFEIAEESLKLLLGHRRRMLGRPERHRALARALE